MIERPPTVSPQRVTRPRRRICSTVWTNLAEARACSPLLVDDRHPGRAPVRDAAGGQSLFQDGSIGHFPDEHAVATVMYLRPGFLGVRHRLAEAVPRRARSRA